jgi:short chain dehydrogenase
MRVSELYLGLRAGKGLACLNHFHLQGRESDFKARHRDNAWTLGPNIQVISILVLSLQYSDIPLDSVNARAVLFSMKHVIKQMLKQEPKPDGNRGKIVNIASVNGLSGGPYISAYTGSK